MSNKKTEEELKKLKEKAFEKLQDAVSSLHEYACECDLGDERIKAFAVYDAARRAPLAY